MARKLKTVTYRVVAEIVVDKELIDDSIPEEDTLLGESIKVKSGLYENIAYGYITSVTKL